MTTESPETSVSEPDTAVTGSAQFKRFHRSRRDRMLAGVCGGVGEALGVDPIVIRVVVVVLTFFGGAGVVAYIAGWLLLADGEEASPVRRALGRRGGEAWTGLALIGLLALAVVITLDSLVSGWGPGHHRGPFPLLVLFALFAGGYLLMKRQDAHSPASGPPVDLRKPTATAYPASPTPATPWVPPVPGPAPPAESRSVVGLATFSLILIALGGLAVARTLGLEVPPLAFPAVVLAGSGIGLLVATRYGRARGLVALGIVALVAVGPTAVATEFEGHWVADDTPIRPAVAELAPEYRYRVGGLTLDLTAIDFTGLSAQTRVSLGAGEIRIVLPENVDVTIRATLRAGDLEILGQRSDGLDNHRTVQDLGADGPGGGVLDLTINQGVGQLQVVRAPGVTAPAAPQVPAPIEPAAPVEPAPVATPVESTTTPTGPTAPVEPVSPDPNFQSPPATPSATIAPEVNGAAA